MSFLANKRILVGITGSIAAYKSPDLVRRLREAGATVRVVMTENAKRFITPLTLQAVSGFPVHDELFDLQAEAAMGHIELARFADLIVVAPASADFIARLQSGRADDLLTTICLATQAKIALAPAMNQGMWRHVLTQTNQQALAKHGVHMLGTGEGSQACGDVGPGRMLEPNSIVAALNELFRTGTLAGLRVVITAGPTHEHIDPVRYLTNGSSGKMGYALAEAAREAGAEVCLISGPVQLSKPQGMTVIPVVTAEEMYQVALKEAAHCDIFLSVAAVGDYRAETIANEKIHRRAENLHLHLTPNPDIVAAVANQSARPFTVGFAAETNDMLASAQAKLTRKKLDMIIANSVAVGMGTDENAVTIVSKDTVIDLPLLPKNQLARQLIEIIATQFKQRKA